MSPISSSIAQFIADREGLAGGARTWFLEILRREFRYDVRGEEPGWEGFAFPAMLLSAVVLGAVGMVREGLSWADGTAWLACAWLGTAGHWLVRRKRQAPLDRDAEWQVYCLLVRPLILLRYPTLLDRNRKDTEYWFAEESRSIKESLKVTANHSRWELAVAALVGLWAGAIIVAVLHYASGVALIALSLLPVASAAAAPIAWAAWRWYALRSVLQDVGE